jgi:uncharacterized protein
MTTVLDEDALRVKLARAREIIGESGAALVAFSAGVDSTLLLKLAAEVLGPRCEAVTTLSPSFPPWERAEATRLAQQLGVAHRFVESRELEQEAYASNPSDRCFYCKQELFALLRGLARERGGAALLFGANADDYAGDHRPGHRAAEAADARAPLAEAGLSKAEVREASRLLGLPTWDKPQLACLASRFPYGTRITAEGLRQVAAAEEAVRGEGFFDVRVRFHGDVARIEVGEGELARFSDEERRRRVAAAVRGAGFRYAALDLDGFRSGRLNDALDDGERGDAQVPGGVDGGA